MSDTLRTSRYVNAVFEGDELYVVAEETVYQWDKGLTLRVAGINTALTYEVHFAYDGQSMYSPVLISTSDEDYVYVDIPDVALMYPREVFAYLSLTTGEEGTDDWVTREVRIQLTPRAKPTDYKSKLTDSQNEIVGNLLSAVNNLGYLVGPLSNIDATIEQLEIYAQPTVTITQTEDTTTFAFQIGRSRAVFELYVQDGVLWLRHPLDDLEEPVGRIVMLYKGAWDKETTYDNLDIVRHDGKLYLCTVDGTIGILPTEDTHWVLFLDPSVAIEEEREARITADDTEREERIAADNTEREERIAGDQNLQDQIDERSLIQQLQEEEINTLKQQIQSLADAINSSNSSNSSALSALADDLRALIEAERQERMNEDNDLSADITACEEKIDAYKAWVEEYYQMIADKKVDKDWVYDELAERILFLNDQGVVTASDLKVLDGGIVLMSDSKEPYKVWVTDKGEVQTRKIYNASPTNNGWSAANVEEELKQMLNRIKEMELDAEIMTNAEIEELFNK